MATEYTFYGAAELANKEILAFMANAVRGSVTPLGYVERDGLQVTAFEVPSGDKASAADLFGFDHRVTATFRFANLASAELKRQNTVLMFRAVIQLFQEYPSDGVLLFNGEEVVLQRLRGAVALNSEWGFHRTG